MMDDRIQIRGNKEGINAIIEMEKFSNFNEMLDLLIDKLTAGKSFYKGSSLKITANLNKVNEIDIKKLKDTLFEEILIKECTFEEYKKDEEKDSKIFNGVYEGKTKFIKKTVRGGQLINYPGNIVIIGDINNGAEVHAGGNIVVLGTIKGKVHAGASGNKKAIISAFSLQPEILQIEDIITISPEESSKPLYPEIAKIKDDTIVVEPYLPNKYIY
ncbi:septum site-determining protein MinC [Clostridium chauvoei]|nr:septum site-determining protein MinC [Clostridium chauvoei]MBX7280227.1 septum site-determining protein MinC [Clostridium chauvoei]MBX7282663.1 septum site-determining protein MinC [Clostridium chauvoei]MBX7285118.1 septum site-determining protein MinC [Clostridium chauvoei]MBX7287624.1 septum site-determining protein MinC [Clostridium chauvoei]MBX7290314.1 septum site-determining protein MinC [Clostridium chauvoei]